LTAPQSNWSRGENRKANAMLDEKKLKIIAFIVVFVSSTACLVAGVVYLESFSSKTNFESVLAILLVGLTLSSSVNISGKISTETISLSFSP
jgi:hypothetical protein